MGVKAIDSEIFTVTQMKKDGKNLKLKLQKQSNVRLQYLAALSIPGKIILRFTNAENRSHASPPTVSSHTPVLLYVDDMSIIKVYHLDVSRHVINEVRVVGSGVIDNALIRGNFLVRWRELNVDFEEFL